jgi:hypothetical protein
MEKKRGEISTEQIVLLIILLISFVIILFFLFGLNLGKESDSEICHNSVAMRGTAPVAKDAVPLKCSRAYICISKDGSCEKMTKPEIKKVKTKEEIYNILAEEMANCWWMFGEGKVDYVGKDFFIRDNYCSICSQIAFDDSIKEIEGITSGQISKDELYTYLSKTPMPNSQTNYAQYLFGTNAIDTLKKQKLTGEDGSQITAQTFGTINTDKQYFVIMGITSEVNGKVWKTAIGVGVAVAGFYIPGAGWTLAGSILGSLITAYGDEVAAIIVPGNGIKNNFMAPTIQEANSNSLKELNCYDIITST